MPKVNLSKYHKSLPGGVGDRVFRQKPDGSIVVNSDPKKKRRASRAQKRRSSANTNMQKSSGLEPEQSTRL